jgi:hypothetical protein
MKLSVSEERRSRMEIKERWIFILFLFFILLTLVMSGVKWTGDLIDNGLSAGNGRKVIGVAQNASGEVTEVR